MPPIPDATPLFSVLIVNYNAGPYLERCLRSLRAQSYQAFEAVIVDNNSHDDSLSLCAAHLADPRFRLVRMSHNAGFAAGNNRAAALARGEWIATLNPDAFPEADWLAELSAAVKKYPNIDMFGSTQVDAKSPSKLDGAGDSYLAIGIPWRGGFGHPIATANLPYEVFGPCAAAALYRASAFRSVGGFDEDFFCYVEDADLAFRLRLAGSRCIQLNSAVVHHIGGASGDKGRSFARYHGTRNMTWALLKNMPMPLLIPLLPAHALGLLFLLIKALLRGDAGPVFRGMIDALKGTKLAWKKRRAIQLKRKVSIFATAGFICWSPLLYFRRMPHIIGPAESAPANRA